LADDFRFAGAVDRFAGFAAVLVRLAAGRLAATAREDLALPSFAAVVFEFFFAGFALAGFGTVIFAGLDRFAFFA
jgi:hypothetical protein